MLSKDGAYRRQHSYCASRVAKSLSIEIAWNEAHGTGPYPPAWAIPEHHRRPRHLACRIRLASPLITPNLVCERYTMALPIAPIVPRASFLNRDSFMTSDHKTERQPGWLFVVPWSIGSASGANQVVKELAKRLEATGQFSAHLIAPTNLPGEGFSSVHDVSLWPPLSRTRPVAAIRSFILRLPYRLWTLRKIIRQNEIQVVNPHCPGLGCVVFILLRKAGMFRGRIILSFHGADVPPGETHGLERKLWALLLRHADRIIVVSDGLAAEVLALDPRVANKIKRVYNGVDLALFSNGKNGRPGANPRHSERTKFILSIGAFVRIKGHDNLVRAFARVSKEFPEARLIVVGGDGPEYGPLRNLIDSLSLTQKVALHKNVPHERIPEFLSGAAVFALASRAEGFPLVVTEAAASKVPVVCTRAAGLRELISDRVTGILVDIDDHVALADAIIHVLDRPEEARAMAERFHQYVRSNFAWDRTCQGYVEAAAT
jgi:glycosyltransferase involved in cell wall biosynthesis